MSGASIDRSGGAPPEFLRDWCASHGVEPGFAEFLADECPWLDGTSEVSDELSMELLTEPFGRWGLSECIPPFVQAYNAFVLVSSGVQHPSRDTAYAAMHQVLSRLGQHSAIGEGDFWLVEDSVSTQEPRVVVFDASFRFSVDALEKLAAAAALCPFFSAVVIADREGVTLQVAAVRQQRS